MCCNLAQGEQYNEREIFRLIRLQLSLPEEGPYAASHSLRMRRIKTNQGSLCWLGECTVCTCVCVCVGGGEGGWQCVCVCVSVRACMQA